MTALKPQLSPATLDFARLLAIGLLSGWSLLMAQSGFAGVLLEIMPAANGPDLPVEAIETKGVRIDAVQIARLEPRSVFDVEIAADRFVEFTVTDVGHYLNGDKHISAGAQAGAKNYSMTLTVGAARLFGYLSADTLVWQVDALRDAEVYQGWAYLPAGLPAAELNNDYFIPPSALVPPPLRSLAVPVQALKVGGGDGALTASEPQNASLPNFSASKLQISQSFEPDPVIAGGTADAVITLKKYQQ
jgi:L-rhamnose mutarotase